MKMKREAMQIWILSNFCPQGKLHNKLFTVSAICDPILENRPCSTKFRL